MILDFVYLLIAYIKVPFVIRKWKYFGSKDEQMLYNIYYSLLHDEWDFSPNHQYQSRNNQYRRLKDNFVFILEQNNYDSGPAYSVTIKSPIEYNIRNKTAFDIFDKICLKEKLLCQKDMLLIVTKSDPSNKVRYRTIYRSEVNNALKQYKITSYYHDSSNSVVYFFNKEDIVHFKLTCDEFIKPRQENPLIFSRWDELAKKR